MLILNRKNDNHLDLFRFREFLDELRLSKNQIVATTYIFQR